MITKKLLLLLLLWPFLLWSQTNLVKWYLPDFFSTKLENHISASNISVSGQGVSITNQEWGVDNVFYSIDGNNSTTSVDTSKYIQFALSPDAGYKIELNNFYFSSRAQSGSNQKYVVRYSKAANFSSFVTSGEKTNATSYTSNNIDLTGTTVTSGETLYIRIYVYNTNNNFHILHNISGSVAPYITGKVSLVTPVVATANDDSVGTYKNTAFLTNVLDNDNYKYTAPITQINITSQPENGVASVNGVENITYTPSNNYVGYDEFYYTITNSVGVSNTAKVKVQVIDNAGTGTEKVLVRWRSNDNLPNPTNYVTGVTGVKASSSEMNVWAGNDGAYDVYFLNGLPSPQVNNGSLKESNYMQFAIKAGNSNDYNALLKKFEMEYRSEGGTGNLTIKYSKDSSFSTGVYVLNNNTSYNNAWTSVSLNFDPLVSFLYPGETMYVRLYAYNTNNKFMIKHNFDQQIGPAITGSVSQYYPEPCQETVTWTASGWSGLPNINKKAIIQANYSTSVNGEFEACSVELKAGKLIVSSNNYVKINKAITLSGTASIEVESDGNLIQVNKNIVNTSPITVKRSANLKKNDYNYWGAPVSGQNLKAFSPNTLNTRFYTYNETNDMFVAVDPNANSFVPGVGYAIRAANNLSSNTVSVPSEFNGVPNNGDISVEVKKSSTGNGYNLIGNPYPSNIDFAKFYDDNKGVINNIAYFWTNINPNPAMQGANYPSGAYINNYAILNGSGGVPATSPACNNASNKKCSDTPNQYIKVGQGFIVQSKVMGNNTVTFKNTSRSTNLTSKFFNRMSSKDSSVDKVDRFWLSLVTPLNVENKILIAYKPDATNGFEMDYDAPHLIIGADSFYSILNQDKLAIQGRKYPLLENDAVQLGASFYAPGNYTISLQEKEGIFSNGQAIYLKDKTNNAIVNLQQESYSFTVSTAGEINTRFEIIYKPDGILATQDASLEGLKVYKVDGGYRVIANKDTIISVEIFDFTGKLINKVNPNTSYYNIDSKLMKNGVYLLKVKSKTKELHQKIIL